MILPADCPTTSAAGINKNRHKSFLSPNFVPFIVEMKANTGNSKLEVTGSCLLRLESGRKLSGLPNHFDYASAPTGYPTYADIAADSQCLVRRFLGGFDTSLASYGLISRLLTNLRMNGCTNKAGTWITEWHRVR